MFTDTCVGCGLNYPLKPSSDEARVYVFLENPDCGHAIAKCPDCGFITRIFYTAEQIMQLIQYGVKVSVCLSADDEIMADYAEVQASEEARHQERFEEWLIENATDSELREELGL